MTYRERSAASLDQIAYLGLLVSPLVLPVLEKCSPVEAVSGFLPTCGCSSWRKAKTRLPDQMRRNAILDRVRSHDRLVLFEHAGHMDFRETYPDLYQRSVLVSRDFRRAKGSRLMRRSQAREQGNRSGSAVSTRTTK